MAGIFIGKKIVEQKVCARIFLSIPVFVGGVSNIIGACGGGEARRARTGGWRLRRAGWFW
jgi:hypothetical protein